MFSPEQIKAVGDLIHQNGVVAVLLLFYVIKDWMFTTSIVANNSKIATILGVLQTDGIKCRHE